MDLLELEQGIDPARHWYYRAKARALMHLLQIASHEPRLIKDVGAGSGFFSEVLLREHAVARAVCIDPHYTDEQIARSDARLTFSREDTPDRADLYLFMDVIEHVPEDGALLAAYVRDALPGSIFIVSVPAFMALWSGHDEFLSHYRRYALPHVERVVSESGLTVIHGRYLYGTIFPVVAGLRLLRRGRRSAKASDMRPARPVVNAALDKVLEWECRLPANRLAGSTAFVLARKGP